MGGTASAVVTCGNQGCTHNDIASKCWSHGWYHCQQRTNCFICGADLSRGTLSAHYGSEHQDITCRAGSTWRATGDGVCLFRLVSSVAGTAVCRYYLNDTEFDLSVYIPVTSERLREFRCEVKVTHPTTGHTRTYKPDVQYDKKHDWHLKVKKKNLPLWSREFDVIVNISKIQ